MRTLTRLFLQATSTPAECRLVTDGRHGQHPNCQPEPSDALHRVHLIGNACAMESVREGFLLLAFARLIQRMPTGFLGPAARYCSEDRRGFSESGRLGSAYAVKRSGGLGAFRLFFLTCGKPRRAMTSRIVQKLRPCRPGRARNRQNSYEFSASGDTQLRQTGDRCCHRFCGSISGRSGSSFPRFRTESR